MPWRLLFQDEGRFGRISDSRRCWAPLPMRPVVGQQVVREYIYGFVAVSPFDGRCTSLILPWVDTQTMSIFLAHTAEQFTGQFCVMFLDQAGWHCAKKLKVPQTICLQLLPAYSPELNPVEHIWDYLRENVFGNDNFDNLQEVGQRLCYGLRVLEQKPELIKSMTCFAWINTLSMTSN